MAPEESSTPSGSEPSGSIIYNRTPSTSTGPSLMFFDHTTVEDATSQATNAVKGASSVPVARGGSLSQAQSTPLAGTSHSDSPQLPSGHPTSSAMALRSAIITSRATFPMNLYRMLEDAEAKDFDDVISWNQNGTGFAVHDIEYFTKNILPSYFKQSKYKSFQRQLSLYGFHRVESGPLKGLRSHPQFVRGSMELTRHMRPSSSSSSAAPAKATPKIAEQKNPSRIKIPGAPPPPISHLICQNSNGGMIQSGNADDEVNLEEGISYFLSGDEGEDRNDGASGMTSIDSTRAMISSSSFDISTSASKEAVPTPAMASSSSFYIGAASTSAKAPGPTPNTELEEGLSYFLADVDEDRDDAAVDKQNELVRATGSTATAVTVTAGSPCPSPSEFSTGPLPSQQMPVSPLPSPMTAKPDPFGFTIEQVTPGLVSVHYHRN